MADVHGVPTANVSAASSRPKNPVENVAVVVVHGIGEQLRGETLLEWCEPLIRRADYFAKIRGLPLSRIESSNLLADGDSHVTVDISVGRAEYLRVTFTEALWSKSFLKPRLGQVAHWAAVFAVRAGIRLAGHLWRRAIGTWAAPLRTVRRRQSS